MGVLGIALHRAATEASDLFERARERDVGDPTMAMGPADEKAGDAPVRQLLKPLLVRLLVLDPR
jgi:hypothetical protein